MRIGIDASMLHGEKSGVATYTEELTDGDLSWSSGQQAGGRRQEAGGSRQQRPLARTGLRRP
ncbi:MAG TPA: hypothetical protein VGK99_07575 [Acidobacteriota bacterium]